MVVILVCGGMRMTNLEFAMVLIERYESIAQETAPEFIIKNMLDNHVKEYKYQVQVLTESRDFWKRKYLEEINK